MVLQSLSQLDDIYGKSNATTIISNTSVKVLYRVSNYETLSEFSRMCGEKETLLDNGLVKKEPLISPVQLGAMDVGQALVIISGRTKYITRFPDYTDLFNLTDEKKEIDRGITYRKRKKTKTFDVKEYVKARKNERLKAAGMLKEDDLEVRKPLPFPYPFDVTDESSLDWFMLKMVFRISNILWMVRLFMNLQGTRHCLCQEHILLTNGSDWQMGGSGLLMSSYRKKKCSMEECWLIMKNQWIWLFRIHVL